MDGSGEFKLLIEMQSGVIIDSVADVKMIEKEKREKKPKTEHDPSKSGKKRDKHARRDTDVNNSSARGGRMVRRDTQTVGQGFDI